MGHDMKVFSRGYGWYISDYSYVARGQITDGSTCDLSYNICYDIIYNSNVILEKADDLQGSQDEKDFIKAQAHSLRAFAYFWLAQWHAPTYVGNESAPCCPLKLESSEEHAPVSTVGDVYNTITSDLDNAITLFQGSSEGRPAKSQIDLSVAQGIRARVALTMNDWTTAISNAQAARADYSLMDGAAYTSGFNDVENVEWMWGLDINDEQATIYASFFSHLDPTRLSYASLGLQKQMPQYLFDTIPDTDIRKQIVVEPGDDQWFGLGNPVPTYSVVKFIAGSSWAADYVLMRAAEMYLIEAEAAAEAGQDAVAQAAINVLIDVRDPGVSTSNTGQALVDEIRLQRRIELWGEGFGLFDVKRWKIPLDRTDHDPTLCVVTDTPANSSEFNMRIPQREIDANDAMTEADQID
ncbi:MAG: RagB/SusD family nutrient uptake outer membrane protein, partial [Bacteroidales bacterium]|nr:RagB/SusD family nutrient uptake outer membrane protein [Bacteroidales bacterium]